MNDRQHSLLSYVRHHQWALWVAMPLACIVGLMEASTPFLLGGVVDTWLGGRWGHGFPSLSSQRRLSRHLLNTDPLPPRRGWARLLSATFAMTLSAKFCEDRKS